jgi:hypothetical protein
MAHRLTRAQAVELLNSLVKEADVIRTVLDTCDALINEPEHPNLMRLLGMQAWALEAQRDHMQNMMVQDINALRTSVCMIFTQSHVDAWLDFSDAVTTISQLPFPDVTLEQWANVRGNIVTLFGVNLSPLITDHDNPSPDPDANFVCPEPFRSQILTAGSMTRPITRGNKTVMVYIQENMITPFQPFTGEKEDESLKELISRLDLVHRAPVDQIPYKMKIEAVFRCLDGKAKNAVIGYFGGETRQRYLDLWAQLFKLFATKVMMSRVRSASSMRPP